MFWLRVKTSEREFPKSPPFPLDREDGIRIACRILDTDLDRYKSGDGEI